MESCDRPVEVGIGLVLFTSVLKSKKIHFGRMRENSCRICLSSEENELVELFDYEETQTHAQKLSFCAGIEVCMKSSTFPECSLMKSLPG